MKGVLAHVNSRDLYRDIDEHSTLYRKMIDGRTIFQYITFIEPQLRLNNPLLVESKRVVWPDGTQSIAETEFFSLSREYGGQPLKSDNDRRHPIPIIIAETEHAILGRIRESISLICSLGLGFFLNFGLKAICSPRFSTSDSHIVPFPEGRNAHEVVLEAAAFGFALLWTRVELFASDCTSEYRPARYVEDICRIFARSVVIDACRRNNELVRARELAEALRQTYFRGRRRRFEIVLDKASSIPLTRELCAYWLPLWDRSRIIFLSPFDIETELPQE